jgi:hypothetical protein
MGAQLTGLKQLPGVQALALRLQTAAAPLCFAVLLNHYFARPGWCCLLEFCVLIFCFQPKDYAPSQDGINNGPVQQSAKCQSTSDNRQSTKPPSGAASVQLIVF